MPHVVIEEAQDLAAGLASLEPSMVRTDGQILKVVDVYLNKLQRCALVECVAVEGGTSRSFFVQCAQKDRQITVRLLPATDPEKTPGVKQLMGIIAKHLHGALAGSRYGKTNLAEYLK